jgi:hypothetical protein
MIRTEYLAYIELEPDFRGETMEVWQLRAQTGCLDIYWQWDALISLLSFVLTGKLLDDVECFREHIYL